MAQLVVNAGGSATKVAALESGQITHSLFQSANFQSVGVEGIRVLLSDITKQLKAKSSEYSVIAGFAGAVNDRDFALIKDAFIQQGFVESRIEVTGDIDLYLKAVAPGTILLVSGTGSIGAVVVGGKVVRVGGYGPLTGDKGSGVELGRDAIRQALLGSDGRIPATVLTQAVADFFNLKHISEVIRPLHNGTISVTQIAALSPLVFKAARENDHAALSIIRLCAQGLASILSVLLKKTAEAQPKVALCGGLFEGDSREMLFGLLREELGIPCEYSFFGERPSDLNLMQALISR